MAKSDKELISNYKNRISKQNQNIKNNYDRVSAVLPKGTINKIKSLGITINAAINSSLLPFLDSMEEGLKETIEQTELLQNEPKNESVGISSSKEQNPKNKPITESELTGDELDYFNRLNEYIKSRQEENERNKRERAESRKLEVEREYK